jgi:hypothetical protein
LLWRGGPIGVPTHGGKRVSATLFHRMFNMMSDVAMPANVGDFRLMDRSAVDAVNDLPENRCFMNGLLAWTGSRTEEIEYIRPVRTAGKAKFNTFRLVNLAIEGVTSFSTAPLRLVTYMGNGQRSFAPPWSAQVQSVAGVATPSRTGEKCGDKRRESIPADSTGTAWVACRGRHVANERQSCDEMARSICEGPAHYLDTGPG